jgi:hypothetical protein
VPASSSSTSTHASSCSLSSASGATLSGPLSLGGDELSGGSEEAPCPEPLHLSLLPPPGAKTGKIETSLSFDSVTKALGPAQAPSIAVGTLSRRVDATQAVLWQYVYFSAGRALFGC